MTASHYADQTGPVVRKRRWPIRLASVFAVLFALVSVVVIAFGVGSLLPAQTNSFTFYSSYFWATIAPHLFVASVVGLALAVLILVRGRRRLGAVLSVVTLVASVWSGVAIGSIVSAASSEGGSVNPVSALAVGSMAAKSDAREVFATVDGQPLSASIYRPRASETPAPVMMYIHGGGWINGSDAGLGYDMRWFADHGWVVVSVDYRLATAAHATWDEAPKDVGCALEWTAQNAARFGGDGSRIVVSGDSAGGNLAINVAYSAAKGTAASSCGGTVPVPKAVVAQYPVVDPLNAYRDGFPAPGFEPKVFTAHYLGGSPAKFPARLAAISSSTYLSASAPPTLVIEPQRDGLIPTAGVEAWIREAKTAGAPVTSVGIPFANHTYNQLASGSLGNQAGLTIEQAYLTRIGVAR